MRNLCAGSLSWRFGHPVSGHLNRPRPPVAPCRAAAFGGFTNRGKNRTARSGESRPDSAISSQKTAPEPGSRRPGRWHHSSRGRAPLILYPGTIATANGCLSIDILMIISALLNRKLTKTLKRIKQFACALSMISGGTCRSDSRTCPGFAAKLMVMQSVFDF